MQRDIKAGQIFSKHKGGVNFMTPTVQEYGYCPDSNYVYELSYGSGIFSRWMVGVSIVHIYDGYNADLSQAFSNDDKQLAFKAAREYIATIE